MIRIQWAAYSLLSSLFSLTLSTKLRIWPRSENPDLALIENLDLVPIGKSGSGPNRKMRIWSRSENADLAPMGKSGSGPDRKMCIQIRSRSQNSDAAMSALPTTANHYKQYLLGTGYHCGAFSMVISGIMRADFSYACGPIPNHGALFIIQYSHMLPWPW